MDNQDKLSKYFSDINVSEYKTDKSVLNSIPKRIIYAFGPLMVVKKSFKDIVKLLLIRFPELSLMKYAANIMEATKDKSCGEIKTSLRSVVAESASTLKDSNFVNIIQNKVKAVIESIRKYQYENKVLENAIINSAPIVPYAGEMKKQWNEAAYGEITDERITRNYAKYFLSLFVNENGARISPEEILAKLLARNVFFIIQNTDLMVNDPRDIPTTEATQYIRLCTDVDRLLVVDENNGRDADVKAYYFFAYCMCYNISGDIIYEYLNHFKTAVTENLSNVEDMRTLIDSMKDDYIEEEPYILSQESWEELTHRQRLSIQNLLTEAEMNAKAEVVHDIQQAFSYIYNHRYINCDSYTNQLFLDKVAGTQKITNVTYYSNNVMSCLVNDEIMVIPYLDISRDYTMHILCMDKTGAIWTQKDLNYIASPESTTENFMI